MTFAAGLIVGAIGGALWVLGVLLGMVAEDRWDILSFVNRHKE